MKNKNFDIWLGIGLNILHYRKEQGLTQIELAEKCDILIDLKEYLIILSYIKVKIFSKSLKLSLFAI